MFSYCTISQKLVLQQLAQVVLEEAVNENKADSIPLSTNRKRSMKINQRLIGEFKKKIHIFGICKNKF